MYVRSPMSNPYGPAYKFSQAAAVRTFGGLHRPSPCDATHKSPTNMTAAAFFTSPANFALNAPSARKRTGNIRALATTAAILCAAAAPGVHAEAGNPLNDKFSVSLGGFLLSTKTELRVDGD